MKILKDPRDNLDRKIVLEIISQSMKLFEAEKTIERGLVPWCDVSVLSPRTPKFRQSAFKRS